MTGGGWPGWGLPLGLGSTTLLLERLTQAGAVVEDFRCLEAFTIFAVQFRYDVDPEPMGLDRAHWLLRAEQLVEHVSAIIGSEA